MNWRHAVALSAALPVLLVGSAGAASAEGATVYSDAYCDDTYDLRQDVFCESTWIVMKPTEAANGNLVVVANRTYSYSYTDNGILVAGRDERRQRHVRPARGRHRAGGRIVQQVDGDGARRCPSAGLRPQRRERRDADRPRRAVPLRAALDVQQNNVEAVEDVGVRDHADGGDPAIGDAELQGAAHAARRGEHGSSDLSVVWATRR